MAATSTASTFSHYLSRLESFSQLFPLTPLSAPLPLSPAKRPRPSPPSSPSSPSSSSVTDSPPTSALSTSPEECSYFPPSATLILSCLRLPIQTPASSPPPSRPLSRRSSTGCSTKSVRFARCTNASVFPAFSGEEYDRTPIEVTNESESLNLPKRKRDEAEGWIKCVERARIVAEKEKADRAKKETCGEGTTGMSVEGVHGLIAGGGYFGEHERGIEQVLDEEVEGEGEEGEGMVVDDEEDGEEEERVPSPVLGVRTPSPLVFAATTLEIETTTEVVLPPLVPASPLSPSTSSLSFGKSETIPVATEEEEQEKLKEEERKSKCKERYGICALGKYSRAEVFQSYDSLGGF